LPVKTTIYAGVEAFCRLGVQVLVFYHYQLGLLFGVIIFSHLATQGQ
jgi:hypothetical protein